MDADFALLEAEDAASAVQRPLVVLMGWVGAQRDGALLKYAELLAAHGYSSVRSVQPTATAFSPLAGGRQRWALGMMAFLQQQALWPQRRLVFYAFSNGGAFVVEQLMLLAQEDPKFAQLPQTVAGFIFDSAPAFMYPGALQRVVYSLEPPGLLRSLKAAYYSAASAAERLRWGPTRSQSFWDHMLALSWGRPLLYLYSSDDPLAHGARINELVAEKQRRGQAVRARCWDSSEHVGHLRRHRGEYTRLLLGFLADCEASIGSRQEPPRGGNGSGHDDSGSRGSRGGDRAAEVGSGSSGSSGRVAEVLPRARL